MLMIAKDVVNNDYSINYIHGTIIINVTMIFLCFKFVRKAS